MSPETRNLIAAMSLSLAILIGWQLYFVEPELEAQRAAYNEQAAQQSELPQPSGQQPIIWPIIWPAGRPDSDCCAH